MMTTRREWLKGVPAWLESNMHMQKDGTLILPKKAVHDFVGQLRDAVNGEPNEPWDDTLKVVK